MSKKRKADISEEDKEISDSTAKKSHRKKAQLAEESDLTTGSSSNTTIAGTNQECIANSPENSDRSFTEEDKVTSVQKKELDHTKVFVSPSQGKKWVPVFRKTKKILTEKLEKNCEETAAISLEKVQHTDKNVLDTAKRDGQNTVTSSESLQLEDSLAPKVEAEEQVVVPREDLSETLNINMQDQEDIMKLNSEDANSGLFGSNEEIRMESNLQVSISEEEMPVKHVTCTPDNAVNGLEKRELSFTCPLAENSAITCTKENITDYIEGSPKEEKHLIGLNITMEQNKVIQDATDDVKEVGCCESEREKDCLVESVAPQPPKENSIIQLPLVTNISVHTPEEQSNSLCRSSKGEQGSIDARETDQCPDFQTGQTEEENKIHSTSENFEPRANRLTSTNSEQAIDQSNLWMCDKPVEESDGDKAREYSSSLQVDTFVREQNSIGDQDTDWKNLPEIQPVNIYLEKEGDICEPNCKQVKEPEEDDIFESRKISMQEVICNEEREMIKQEAGVKPTPPKSFSALPDPKLGVLMTAEKKESCCENLLSDKKQSEINACDLIPNEIMETMSSTDMDQNATKVSETEEITMENSLFSTDIHNNIKKEIVTCVENESMVITIESGLSSTEVLSVLEAVDDSVRETDANLEAQSNSPVLRINACVSSGLDMDQVCASYTDPPSLDVEFLPDSELQGIFESQSFEFEPHKASILDNPHKHVQHESDVCSAGEQSGNKISVPEPNKTHENNVRDQVTEICDQSRQEDATDVVCGLIKELSNLNRLTMSMHRDLDSFKRLKFRRNRQSNKLLPHSANNMTNTLNTVRKKREM
ncbi:break repair meiotic recombinase recruitment factor 1 [Anolis carolinensis]|uniref:break repair meiotic recombinase recruitment factor 1 n=1 Tax=Anolis carolinensis TaxID=28377 RepID=UPI002F2B8229